MNIQPALRPVNKQWVTIIDGKEEPDKFRWVHLADGAFKPLCGEEYDPERYDLEIESVDLDDRENVRRFSPNAVCSSCAAVYYKFDVEVVRSGQPRPYADSEYLYYITDLIGNKTREEVLEFCRTHVKYGYWPNETDNWAAPIIRGLGYNQSGGVWVYRVVEAFTG